MKTLLTWASQNPALAGIWTLFFIVVISAIVKAITGPSKIPTPRPAVTPTPPVAPTTGVDIIMRTARVPSGMGGGMSGGRMGSAKS